MYFSLSINPLLAASWDTRLMSATNSSILAFASRFLASSVYDRICDTGFNG